MSNKQKLIKSLSIPMQSPEKTPKDNSFFLMNSKTSVLILSPSLPPHPYSSNGQHSLPKTLLFPLWASNPSTSFPIHALHPYTMLHHLLPRRDHRNFHWNPLSRNYQGKLDISFPPLCYHPLQHMEGITQISPEGEGVLLTAFLVRKSHKESMQIKSVHISHLRIRILY